MQERDSVSPVFLKSDNMEVSVSLARTISLRYRDGSQCGLLEREWGAETTMVDDKQLQREWERQSSKYRKT